MQRAGGLAPVISALLEKDPARRPSYGALRDKLRDVAAGRPTGAVVTPLGEDGTLARAAEPEATPAPYPDEEPRRSRVGLVLAGLALLLVLVAAGALAFSAQSEDASEPREQAAANEDEGRGSNNSGPGGGGDGSSGPGTSEDTDTETDIETSSGVAAPPAGWSVYEDPSTGWSIAYPEGWEVTDNSVGDGSSTDFSDPASGAYLRVDWTSPPNGPSAQAAWESYEPGFAAEHADYKRIAMEPTTFQGFEASHWEFTWEEGTTIHAVNLGFIVRDEYGFALNFVAPESEWADFEDEFATFQETYRPPA